MEKHLNRFADSKSCFVCPICTKALSLNGTSLICKKNHCFDIAKSGYVNLHLKPKKQYEYDKTSFQGRHYVLEQGIYEPVLNEIAGFIKQVPAIRQILDAGCGEGYYSRQIRRQTLRSIYAFDLSKDSIQLASKEDTESVIKWFVADLASIPIRDHSIDCILNIFSPANYNEFHRILAPNGYIVKVVPTSNHLVELRQMAEVGLKNKEYSNQRVIDYFVKSFTCIARKKAGHTFPLPEQMKAAFLEMTPLLFHVDKKNIDWSGLVQLTVEAEVLIGRP